MINNDIKTYNYYTIGAKDSYGQIGGISDAPVGEIKMAIYNSSQSIQDNILYKDCSYIGLTQAEVDDTYIIETEKKELLKVMYINKSRRFTEVFLKHYGA